MDINKEYQDIIKRCKFISKKDEWFIEGTEAKCDAAGNFCDYNKGDKFNKGFSLFEGITNETFKGYTGELPREDGEVCPLDEFLIYDEFDNEISDLTLDEYKSLLAE